MKLQVQALIITAGNCSYCDLFKKNNFPDLKVFFDKEGIEYKFIECKTIESMKEDIKREDERLLPYAGWVPALILTFKNIFQKKNLEFEGSLYGGVLEKVGNEKKIKQTSGINYQIGLVSDWIRKTEEYKKANSQKKIIITRGGNKLNPKNTPNNKTNNKITNKINITFNVSNDFDDENYLEEKYRYI